MGGRDGAAPGRREQYCARAWRGEVGYKTSPLRAESGEGGLRTILGGGLLSHDMDRSIIGDGELNYRVRNGVGCTLSSMATKEIPVNLYN